MNPSQTPRPFFQKNIAITGCFPRFATMLPLLLLAAAPLKSQAVVISLYPFTSSSPLSTDTEANSTSSAISAGAGLPGLLYDTTGGTGNPAPSLYAGADSLANTIAGAIAADDYFEFTVTPDSGYAFSLTSLTLDFGVNYTGGYTRSIAVRSSMDSYATNILSYSSTTSLSTMVGLNGDLSDGSYQNLTSPITFRIYLGDGGATSGGSHLRVDNITLNGTVEAVPEPSSLILLSLGMGSLWFLRRRARS